MMCPFEIEKSEEGNYTFTASLDELLDCGHRHAEGMLRACCASTPYSTLAAVDEGGLCAPVSSCTAQALWSLLQSACTACGQAQSLL